MKELKKIIKNTVHQYLNEQILNEDRLYIPKTKLSGIFYHGSLINGDDDIFNELNLGYSDWDAIWLTDDENIAEEFSEWHSGVYDNETRLVFRVKMNVRTIADITYDLSKRIIGTWGLSDFRESIPILKQKGFNGWITTGSLGYYTYNDIAIFNPNLIKIQDVKLLLDNDWTDFMNINDAQELIEKHRE